MVFSFLSLASRMHCTRCLVENVGDRFYACVSAANYLTRKQPTMETENLISKLNRLPVVFRSALHEWPKRSLFIFAMSHMTKKCTACNPLLVRCGHKAQWNWTRTRPDRFNLLWRSVATAARHIFFGNSVRVCVRQRLLHKKSISKSIWLADGEFATKTNNSLIFSPYNVGTGFSPVCFFFLSLHLINGRVRVCVCVCFGRSSIARFIHEKKKKWHCPIFSWVFVVVVAHGSVCARAYLRKVIISLQAIYILNKSQ